MWSIIAVTNKHTAKLHHVGSLYIYYPFMTLEFNCSSVPTVYLPFKHISYFHIFQI